jgi:serine/threonine protein phosphatase 1
VEPQFSSAVASRHTRLDATAYDTIYAVGDVHGCIAELRTLWDRLNPTADDLVVFVGDLVRKGPASDAVVEFVRTRDNAISVRGNNEQLVLDGDTESDLSPANRAAIEGFPLVVSWDETMVVHGGVHPTRPLPAHSPRDLLEMRALPTANGYDGPFWFESYDGPERVVFGHTVLTEPFLGNRAVGLDTGCVHGGRLTAYDCNRGDVASVPAEQTYRTRPDDMVVTLG